MKSEIENTVIRKIIDKSYQAGFDEAVRMTIEWLNKNVSNYIWFDESEVSTGDCCGVTDDFEQDFINAIKLK